VFQKPETSAPTNTIGDLRPVETKIREQAGSNDQVRLLGETKQIDACRPGSTGSLVAVRQRVPDLNGLAHVIRRRAEGAIKRRPDSEHEGIEPLPKCWLVAVGEAFPDPLGAGAPPGALFGRPAALRRRRHASVVLVPRVVPPFVIVVHRGSVGGTRVAAVASETLVSTEVLRAVVRFGANRRDLERGLEPSSTPGGVRVVPLRPPKLWSGLEANVARTLGPVSTEALLGLLAAAVAVFCVALAATLNSRAAEKVARAAVYPQFILAMNRLVNLALNEPRGILIIAASEEAGAQVIKLNGVASAQGFREAVAWRSAAITLWAAKALEEIAAPDDRPEAWAKLRSAAQAERDARAAYSAMMAREIH
jgi:hypothetical protein